MEDGNNAQLIVQDNPDATPFNVVIEDSVVRDIQGVSGFVSNGGSIRVANLEVENVQLSGPLFSVNDNGGVLQLRDLNVERGIGGENQMEVSPIYLAVHIISAVQRHWSSRDSLSTLYRILSLFKEGHRVMWRVAV